MQKQSRVFFGFGIITLVGFAWAIANNEKLIAVTAAGASLILLSIAFTKRQPAVEQCAHIPDNYETTLRTFAIGTMLVARDGDIETSEGEIVKLQCDLIASDTHVQVVLDDDGSPLQYSILTAVYRLADGRYAVFRERTLKGFENGHEGSHTTLDYHDDIPGEVGKIMNAIRLKFDKVTRQMSAASSQ
jgi:hypothetical protein